MPFWDRKPDYVLVSDDEDSDEGSHCNPRTRSRRKLRTSLVSRLLQIGVIVLFGIASFSAGIITANRTRSVARAWKTIHAPCTQPLTIDIQTWLMIVAPMADSIALEANVLSPTHPLSILGPDRFGGDPSPAVDELWQNVSGNAWVWITRKELAQVGMDASIALKVPPEQGFGDDVYVASVAVRHNIHCLDYIRRALAYDHYFREAFEDDETSKRGHEGHVNHCIQVIRHALVCAASTDLVPYFWSHDDTIVDYITHPTCGNYRGIGEWAASRALSFNPFSLKRYDNDI
jgi:hypothetical protein